MITKNLRNHSSGFVCLGLGIFIVAAAWIDPSIPVNRMWMMHAAGASFLLAGVQLLTGATGRLSALMAGSVCSLFSLIGFLTAFGHGPVKGGIPFIPQSWNQTIGHGIFGVGAICTAAAAVWFFWKAIKSGKGN